ncbi:MAG TPA: helix-turn-helix transcriptional regulator [Euzebyales bacterium]
MAGTDDARSSAFPGFDQLRDDLGEVIDDLAVRRRAAGLSQTEVAARMGTSQSAVARLEAGRGDVRVSTLERYAQALGLTMRFGVGPLDQESDA